MGNSFTTKQIMNDVYKTDIALDKIALEASCWDNRATISTRKSAYLSLMRRKNTANGPKFTVMRNLLGSTDTRSLLGCEAVIAACHWYGHFPVIALAVWQHLEDEANCKHIECRAITNG